MLNHNLRVLRKHQGLSQTALAEVLGIKRSRLNAWENGLSEPSIQHILLIADHFRVNVDRLLRQDLSQLTRFEMKRIEEGYDIDLRGKHLRILTTTVDSQNRENIEVVPTSARAGYTAGYADPEFIKDLPKIQLPFLSTGRTHRTFPIVGDSMPPVSEGSYVIGEYLSDWSNIKNGTFAIVVTQDDGIVFKQVNNWIKERGALQLCSTNPQYEPYEVKVGKILEVWQFVHYISPDIPTPNLDQQELTQAIIDLQKDMNWIKKKI